MLHPVDPERAAGRAVTFVNRDPITHNVGGNLWGNLDDMNRGDAFTATFDAEGVYPFACSYHPGMTGAIVVGSGTGAGNGEDVGAVRVRAAGAGGRGAHGDRAVERHSVAIGWIAGAAIGVGSGSGSPRWSSGTPDPSRGRSLTRGTLAGNRGPLRPVCSVDGREGGGDGPASVPHPRVERGGAHDPGACIGGRRRVSTRSPRAAAPRSSCSFPHHTHAAPGRPGETSRS